MTNIRIFASQMDPKAAFQVSSMGAHPAFEGAKIRIMPDVHAGRGTVIGFTAKIGTGRIAPTAIGVDGACGVLVVPIGRGVPDLKRLDDRIRTCVPAGPRRRDKAIQAALDFPLEDLHCWNRIRDAEDVFRRSAGTLGGGNHFIELDVAENGDHYLLIHSGSRSLGYKVASCWQRLAHNRTGMKALSRQKAARVIELMKAQGREKHIETALAEIRQLQPVVKEDDLAWLEGREAQMFLEDMSILSAFADLNRETIARSILDGLPEDAFHVRHNYIEKLPDGSYMLRKGAVSAKGGEPLVIPLNMRDGSLLCTGKGCEEWNESAPHGAGRLISRRDAMAHLSLLQYERDMEGIYTSCIGTSTLDESPAAYKNSRDIINLIGDTAEITAHLRPVYNFKSDEVFRSPGRVADPMTAEKWA